MNRHALSVKTPTYLSLLPGWSSGAPTEIQEP